MEITYTTVSQPVAYMPDVDFMGLHFMGGRATAADACAKFEEAGYTVGALTDLRQPTELYRYDCENPENPSSRNFTIDQQKAYLIYSTVANPVNILNEFQLNK